MDLRIKPKMIGRSSYTSISCYFSIMFMLKGWQGEIPYYCYLIQLGLSLLFTGIYNMVRSPRRKSTSRWHCVSSLFHLLISPFTNMFFSSFPKICVLFYWFIFFPTIRKVEISNNQTHIEILIKLFYLAYLTHSFSSIIETLKMNTVHS